LLAASTIFSFADFLPSDDGVKTTDTAHCPMAGRLATQVSEGTKSAFDELIELTANAVELGL
jgi:hypothetical protein